jgi:hypothetical protein
MHVFEVRPRKIIAASIQFPMRCHSVGFGMANRMQSLTQSDTQSIAAAHIMP